MVNRLNKPMKAVLLSALVFPGAGHVALKKYIPGAVLAGAAFAGLYILVTRMLERALQIAQKLQSGEARLDTSTIVKLVSEQGPRSEAQLLNIATAVLLVVWLIGIVDSYRVGRLQDKSVEPGD